MPPTPPDNEPPDIDIDDEFLTGVPESGDWDVPVSISDDSDPRSALTVSAQVTTGLGAFVVVTASGITITTTGFLSEGDTLDVEITATDTENATSTASFTFTIGDDVTPPGLPGAAAPNVTITQEDIGTDRVLLEVSLDGGTYDDVDSYAWDDSVSGSSRTVDRPTGVLADTYGVTVTVSGDGTDAEDGTTATGSDTTDVEPAEPPVTDCSESEVTAPDLEAVPGVEATGDGGESGFPPGSGSWSVTDQPPSGGVTVDADGEVSWTAPDDADPGRSDYDLQYSRGGCTATGPQAPSPCSRSTRPRTRAPDAAVTAPDLSGHAGRFGQRRCGALRVPARLRVMDRDGPTVDRKRRGGHQR